jgi:hypothetical protein
LTGKKFDGTPEGLERLEADNQLVSKAKAGRDALPEKPRSVNFRNAQEKADKNPTGENPFESAIIVARANIRANGFRDSIRQDEIPDLEAASRLFEERKSKLAELPRPAPEVIDPIRQTADTLRARPDKLGERLSETVARRLDDAEAEVAGGLGVVAGENSQAATGKVAIGVADSSMVPNRSSHAGSTVSRSLPRTPT